MLCLVITLLTLFTLILMIIFKPSIELKLKNKKIILQSFWIVSAFGMLLLIVFKQISMEGIKSLFDFSQSMNPFKILILFISISILSIVLEIAGFFELCAIQVIKRVKKSQIKLFIILYVLISVLTMFTSNDIIILTFTPFIIYFTKKMNISPIPYLVGEFVAANTLSLMFIIGNPTNIYLATYYNISFFAYFKVMWLPTIVLSLVAFGCVFLLFLKALKVEINFQGEIENNVKINKTLIVVGLIHLVACTICLVISSYIHFEMWYICLFFAISITLFVLAYDKVKHEKNELKIFKHVPWNLIPFIISMFLIVTALNENNILSKIALALSSASRNNTFLEGLIYGVTSFLACSLINNIPMSVAYASILEISQASTNALYAVIIGSNIGALLTPMGALAGIMWLNYLKSKDVNYSFLSFIKNGIIISIPILLSALLTLYLIIN